jgi:ABC-type glycerol-3-phosphate transport system permease component
MSGVTDPVAPTLTPAATAPAPPPVTAPTSRPSRRRRAWRAVRRVNVPAGIGAAAWLVVVALPLYFLVVSAVSERGDYLDRGALAPPSGVTLENFRTTLDSGFARYLLNTAVVTAGTVAIVLALALPAAYAIVRSQSRLAGTTFRLFLLGLAIPAQATIIPVYLIITRLHLYDTLIAIVLPTAAFCLPLSVLVLTGSLRDVPRELYEAMALDGAEPRTMLRRLVIPLSRGGIITVSIYSALQGWNGFLFPLVLTQSEETRVLTLGLWTFQGQFGVNVPGLMAAVLMSAIPFFVLYLFARRWIVAGLVGTGGK